MTIYGISIVRCEWKLSLGKKYLFYNFINFYSFSSILSYYPTYNEVNLLSLELNITKD